MGATISIETTPYILKKGGILPTAKLCCGAAVGVLLGWLLGEKPVESSNLFFEDHPGNA